MALFRSSGGVYYCLCGQVFFFSYFFLEGRHLPEWVPAVVPIEPTFVAGPLVTSNFFRSVGSLGLFAYSGEFWGGLIF